MRKLNCEHENSDKLAKFTRPLVLWQVITIVNKSAVGRVSMIMPSRFVSPAGTAEADTGTRHYALYKVSQVILTLIQVENTEVLQTSLTIGEARRTQGLQQNMGKSFRRNLGRMS